MVKQTNHRLATPTVGLYIKIRVPVYVYYTSLEKYVMKQILRKDLSKLELDPSSRLSIKFVYRPTALFCQLQYTASFNKTVTQ
jgi:hypothetical protein